MAHKTGIDYSRTFPKTSLQMVLERILIAYLKRLKPANVRTSWWVFRAEICEII